MSYPTPNPGGRNRETVRKALAGWLDAQHIPGVNQVLDFRPTAYRFDNVPGMAGANFLCLIGTILGPDVEAREALTGPTDPGGKMITYPATLEIVHRSMSADDAQSSSASEDDYDRIIDAVKDALHGVGRDFGRPEVILTAGEWPRQRSIWGQKGPVTYDRADAPTRMYMINFNVQQYIVKYP